MDQHMFAVKEEVKYRNELLEGFHQHAFILMDDMLQQFDPDIENLVRLVLFTANRWHMTEPYKTWLKRELMLIADASREELVIIVYAEYKQSIHFWAVNHPIGLLLRWKLAKEKCMNDLSGLINNEAKLQGLLLPEKYRRSL